MEPGSALEQNRSGYVFDTAAITPQNKEKSASPPVSLLSFGSRTLTLQTFLEFFDLFFDLAFTVVRGKEHGIRISASVLPSMTMGLREASVFR